MALIKTGDVTNGIYIICITLHYYVNVTRCMFYPVYTKQNYYPWPDRDLDSVLDREILSRVNNRSR